MGNYSVRIPIAGNILVYVEAKDIKEAIEKAFAAASLEDIENWEALTSFNSGNVCHCPTPWEVVVEEDFI